jgi:pSer/pThr/pTyr-binding forkhead associated (FHA) protein
VSDGKASQNGDNPETEKLSSRLGGRFRAPGTAGIDMPGRIPEEDDAVNNVAQRFRAGGFKSSVIESAPTMDEDAGDSGNLGQDALADFLLDALDAAPEPVSPAAEPSMAAIADDDELEDLDTQRVDAAQIQGLPELPMIEVEPLSVAVETKEITCPSCGANNPPGMRFCVQCGGALAPATAKMAAPQAAPAPASVPKAAILDSPLRQSQQLKAPPAVAAPAAETHREPPPPTKAARQENPWPIRLISINEDGTDGTSISLDFLETTVGREGDQRFPTDAFLSPKHARFHIDKGEVTIEDLYSLNGTFIKLRDETRLTPGDTILMGRQVLRFEKFEQPIAAKTKSSDGTRYMGSPSPGGDYKILQVGIGGVIQNVYCLPETGAVLGREKGDIVFPHDKFMSGRHAQIYVGDDGHCYLVDLNSSNGTWIKIWEKTKLSHKDYIFMGQQLFRVHYDPR